MQWEGSKTWELERFNPLEFPIRVEGETGDHPANGNHEKGRKLRRGIGDRKALTEKG